MQIWTEFSTKQVFQNARPGKNSTNHLILHTAQNAYVSGQIVLRNLENFKIKKVSISCDKKLTIRAFIQEYIAFNDQMSYPDELTEVSFDKEISVNVLSHSARSIWVDFFVPKTTKEGKLSAKVTVETSAGNFDADIDINVYDIAIPDPNKSLFDHEYFFNLAPSAAIGDMEIYSEEWWEHMKKTAKIFAELRNNAISISANPILMSSGSRKVSQNKWKYDFTNWDRFVNLFLDAGVAKSFTIGGIIQCVYGEYIWSIGENNDEVKIPTMSEEGRIYLESFFGAIYEHIKGNGTLKYFRSHIEDEPHTTEAWIWARNIIKKVAPKLPCSEPIDMIESAYGLKDECDICVPRTNVFEEDPKFFRELMKKNKLWVYSCCYPEEAWFLNKFIDHPFIQSRIMKWDCVLEGISGFLHWGFNYFGDNSGDSIYGAEPGSRFKGDGHIVYPDPENKSYKLSARFINTRDGLQDAEVMLIKIKDHEDEVKKIIKTVVKSNTSFSEDPEKLQKAMVKMLMLK